MNSYSQTKGEKILESFDQILHGVMKMHLYLVSRLNPNQTVSYSNDNSTNNEATLNFNYEQIQKNYEELLENQRTNNNKSSNEEKVVNSYSNIVFILDEISQTLYFAISNHQKMLSSTTLTFVKTKIDEFNLELNKSVSKLIYKSSNSNKLNESDETNEYINQLKQLYDQQRDIMTQINHYVENGVDDQKLSDTTGKIFRGCLFGYVLYQGYNFLKNRK